MGYRPRRAAAGSRCVHEPEPVTLASGEVVNYLCNRCLVSIRPLRPPGVPIERASWLEVKP